MPIAATPLEQVVVLAEATNWTLVPTVLPFAGLLTTTVANAGNEAAKMSSITAFVNILMEYALSYRVLRNTGLRIGLSWEKGQSFSCLIGLL
jgi:hypothetical protein